MEQARQTRLQSEQNKKAVDDLREDFDDHLRKDGVHRSADSEARISRIDSGINAIGSILTDIQTQLARLGAGRQRS